MDIKQTIKFGEDRADLFGGKMEEFIKISLEALRKQRPKGHWIQKTISYYKCSECGKAPYYSKTIQHYKFCPYCGADMREVVTQ